MCWDDELRPHSSSRSRTRSWIRHLARLNFFDTANVYGRHLGVGTSEDIIGKWFDKGSGRRDKVVLATKVYGTMGDWPNESRLSKLSIIRQCEESLRRLRTDTIDLYQMHHIDRNAWWDEIWEAMEQLKRQGKILTSARRLAGCTRRANGCGDRISWPNTEQSVTTARGHHHSRCPRGTEYGRASLLSPCRGTARRSAAEVRSGRRGEGT